MKSNDKLQRFLARHPHDHTFFLRRPHWTRRRFFEVLGAGITGSFLVSRAPAHVVETRANVRTINKARSVIFILLAGAPSHIDTFDFKETPDTPMDRLTPQQINGLVWPTGLLPKLGESLADLAIIRSMRAWALVHGLAQTWTQIGRNPAAALGDIAPNIGSIVAIEKERERKATDVFPSFLALNAGNAVGSGYLPATYAPLKVQPNAGGLRNTSNPDGQGRMDERIKLLETLDAPLRNDTLYGNAGAEFDPFYKAALGLMYNSVVEQAFRYSAEDSQRYGGGTPNAFGNACLIARQVLQANAGTRFIQINLGGWDHHADIYANNNLPRLSTILDEGVSALLADLKKTGLLDETLVIMAGEFGRTVGRLSAQNGRDHYLQQSCVFAGAGVRGGRAIGSTNELGSASVEYGWVRERDIRTEDIEATIYSALGINWTTVRYDDPFGRGFEYVPYSGADIYGPVHELWS
ncbi:MAG: DUF1501 domain-containing protein [Bryobacteraceae bacterium]